MTSELPRSPSQANARSLQTCPASTWRVGGVVRVVILGVARAMAIVTMGLTVSACSGDRETAEAAANAPFGVQTTELFVTIENKAGTPLINVAASIVSVSGQPFTRLVSRMENGEKRDFSLNGFSGRDGTTFSLRVVRPKSVRVAGEDLAGQKYQADVAWK
jgi:hypothetical protein